MKVKTILIILVALTVAGSLHALPWQDKDKALLRALQLNQLGRFERLLKSGADPNALFEDNPEEWVMCRATARGNEEFLRLAVENGGDINLRNEFDIVSLISAPVLCAINQHNDEAFDYLLSQGVDLNIRAWQDAVPKPRNQHITPELWGKTLYGSPLTHAAQSNNYKIVYEIMTRKNLREDELFTLISGITLPNGIDVNGEGYQWRIKVIELLRELGHEVIPWEPPEALTE